MFSGQGARVRIVCGRPADAVCTHQTAALFLREMTSSRHGRDLEGMTSY